MAEAVLSFVLLSVNHTRGLLGSDHLRCLDRVSTGTFCIRGQREGRIKAKRDQNRGLAQVHLWDDCFVSKLGAKERAIQHSLWDSYGGAGTD